MANLDVVSNPFNRVGDEFGTASTARVGNNNQIAATGETEPGGAIAGILADVRRFLGGNSTNIAATGEQGAGATVAATGEKDPAATVANLWGEGLVPNFDKFNMNMSGITFNPNINTGGSDSFTPSSNTTTTTTTTTTAAA